MESSTNNTTRQLAIGETWSGVSEFRDNTVTIAVNLITTKNCVVFVQQSTDNINFVFDDQYAHEISIIGTESRFQVPAKARFYRVKVENVSGEVIPQIIVTTYFLDVNKDSTLEQPAIIAGDVIVLNAIQAKDYEFNTLRDVSCDNTGHLLVNVNNDVIVQGQNNNYEFFPTATNNTSAVYADGTQGVNVAGGWSYSNIATGKINWYLYGSTGLATDYKVSQLNSMYTVVNNMSTLGLALAQNPWIMIYTRPDSGTNGAGWYKSKLFFGSNAHTDTLGIKLLYTGSDPVDVHPEITGINRIQLLFVEALSTKPLAEAQNENIMLGSLQTTNNTSQVGAFNFVMEEFGADWVKTPSILPIEFNKVMCDITGQSVVVSSGTVVVSSQPHLSYLTDNVAVSTMPAITGTVAVSSQPHLSYLTDNIAVSTMPAITGTVAVSSQPHLSYLTDNIAVATQPALSFSIDKVDVTGSSVVVSTLPSIPTGTNSIGTVITDEKSATSAPFVTGITQSTSITISSSANTKLISINPVNQGAVTTIAWYKLYNGLNKQSTDTADLVTTFGVTSSSNNTNPEIHLSSLLFPNGVSVRVTGNSTNNDNSAPTGTQSLTAVIYV